MMSAPRNSAATTNTVVPPCALAACDSQTTTGGVPRGGLFVGRASRWLTYSRPVLARPVLGGLVSDDQGMSAAFRGHSIPSSACGDTRKRITNEDNGGGLRTRVEATPN